MPVDARKMGPTNEEGFSFDVFLATTVNIVVDGLRVAVDVHKASLGFVTELALEQLFNL